MIPLFVGEWKRTGPGGAEEFEKFSFSEWAKPEAFPDAEHWHGDRDTPGRNIRATMRRLMRLQGIAVDPREPQAAAAAVLASFCKLWHVTASPGGTSILEGIRRCPQGGRVLVVAGAYAEDIVLDEPGLRAKDITVYFAEGAVVRGRLQDFGLGGIRLTGHVPSGVWLGVAAADSYTCGPQIRSMDPPDLPPRNAFGPNLTGPHPHGSRKRAGTTRNSAL